MDNLPQRIAMPCPFAGGDGASFTEPVNGSSESNMNWQKGFGSNYSAPASNGGKYVTRAEMNGLGRVATQDIFYHKCGGINTFDSEFATAIGGYPKGAVLDYVFGSKIIQVMSLVPNNKVDFNAVGIDGENWIALNRDEAYIDGQTTIGSISQNITSTDDVAYLGIIKSSISGIVGLSDVEVGPNREFVTTTSSTYGAGSITIGSFFVGNAIAVKNLGKTVSQVDPLPTVSNLNGWNIIPSQVGFLYKTTLTARVTYNSVDGWQVGEINFSPKNAINTIPKQVEKGDFIAFCAIFGTNYNVSCSTSSGGTSNVRVTTSLGMSSFSSFKAKVTIS